jgi:CspA family cold shock protein
MLTGTVCFFSDSRGFGFLKPDDGGSDIFFHRHALIHANIDTIEVGDRLSFDTRMDRFGKGLQAISLAKVA